MLKGTWEVKSAAAYIRAEDMLFVRMGRESSIPKYQAKTPFFGDDEDEYDLRRNGKRRQNGWIALPLGPVPISGLPSLHYHPSLNTVRTMVCIAEDVCGFYTQPKRQASARIPQNKTFPAEATQERNNEISDRRTERLETSATRMNTAGQGFKIMATPTDPFQQPPVLFDYGIMIENDMVFTVENDERRLGKDTGNGAGHLDKNNQVKRPQDVKIGYLQQANGRDKPV
nr:hypothetical protein Iba_chr15fCG3580 [Ipomoea batatas]